MKSIPLRCLLLVSAAFSPLLQAQDAKVREIEQKVLLDQYQNAVRALIGSASEAEGGETDVSPELLGKRLQWLALVTAQLEAAGKTPTPNHGDMAGSAAMLNALAWKLVTSSDVEARHPEIALELATIALELGGENWHMKPNVLATQARALFLLGKHGEAVAEQEKAVAAAVAEQKAGLEATLSAYKRNELPEVHPEADPATSGVAQIVEKLRRIIIPRIDFEDTTVKEAVEFLRQQSIELDTTEPDPAKKGVNFVIRRPRPAAGLPDAANDPGALRVKELRLRNAPLAVVLMYICDATKLRYKVDDRAVTILPQSDGDDFFTRTFQVPPDFASSLNPGSDAGKVGTRPPIIELLKSAGVNFGEGSSVALTASGALLVTNTPTELDKIELLVAAAIDKSEWTRKDTPAPAAGDR